MSNRTRQAFPTFLVTTNIGAMDLWHLTTTVGSISVPLLLLGLYVYWNDRRWNAIPPSALYFGPKRFTPDDVRAMAERVANSPPIATKEVLPSRTGRRYIVVGGSGFLGAWIVTKLLERGEELHRIRILDLNPPGNRAVKDALSRGVQFTKVDVTDAQALTAAFKAPWPTSPSNLSGTRNLEITVFHTAANIRFYERHVEFLSRSTKVNVIGTENVINASREVGATVLVYTSSASVAIHANKRFLLWPWEATPETFVQIINDDDNRLPKEHDQFFSNYAVTKIMAERLVRAANGQTTGHSANKTLKTGAIRPGNGIFGPRGDMLAGAYIVRKNNPSWLFPFIQSCSYVENCAAAHLCYEARLIELLSCSSNPDISGQAFCIADPGTTLTSGDMYTALETLTDGECHFPSVSPTFMLLLAHCIEWYYRTHNALLSRGWQIAKKLPAIGGDLVNLQPSLFSLTSVHVIVDDSRARLPPAKGGLGYTGTWTTLEGLHRTVEEHKSGLGRSDSRSDSAGVSFKFSFKFGRKKTVGTTVVVPVPDSLKVADAVQVVSHAPVEVTSPH